MVGDVLNWSLSRARCFVSGLCVFPGDEGGCFLDYRESKRSHKAKAGKRSGVEAVTEAKLRVSKESSAQFSAGGISSEISSAESSLLVVSICESCVA